MKKAFFFKALLVVSIIFAGFTAKAQLDTAWYQCDYGNQYVFPPLADSNYRYEGLNSVITLDLVQLLINNNGRVEEICNYAQRYEVKDSIKIMGVATLTPYDWYIYNYIDTVKIGIWDETLSNELYSKTFISGGVNQPYLDTSGYIRFIEYLFDDTLTLYEDYHVSVFIHDTIYYSGGYGFGAYMSCLYLKDQTSCTRGGTNVEYYCTPAGCETKYPLYISYNVRDTLSDWVSAADVDNWYNDVGSYDFRCTYPYVFSGGAVFCDTMVHAPLGICPIKVLEESVQDTTSSGVLSVELLEKAVRVYPNPANEILNVACDYDIESVAVFDVLNRLVEERKVNSKTLQLSLINYAQGTYFITITTEKGKLNKKFVVQ